MLSHSPAPAAFACDVVQAGSLASGALSSELDWVTVSPHTDFLAWPSDKDSCVASTSLLGWSADEWSASPKLAAHVAVEDGDGAEVDWVSALVLRDADERSECPKLAAHIALEDGAWAAVD
mmetsp:Transcript_61354/g.171570  ORF Transcript_61354/g.171570 Transcript_61354/m.171570 type:complete len:121 (+) Transcript_61354:558-920(+)